MENFFWLIICFVMDIYWLGMKYLLDGFIVFCNLLYREYIRVFFMIKGLWLGYFLQYKDDEFF